MCVFPDLQQANQALTPQKKMSIAVHANIFPFLAPVAFASSKRYIAKSHCPPA